MEQALRNYAQNVDNVMLYIIGISFLLLLVITIAMVYFVIRYNRKKNPVASQIEGNKILEIIWIVVPVALVLTMFFYSESVYKVARNVPKGAMNVNVEAKMWQWKFTYENGKVTDTLFLPVGKPVKFNIVSADVNHSFYIPAFRIKEDAIPGRENYMVIEPKDVGAFDIACAEYCGLNHSLMYTKVFVVPENEFFAWYNGEVDNTYLQKFVLAHSGGYKDYITGNYALLFAKGCVQCHSLDGSKNYGPSFTELSRGYAKIRSNGKLETIPIDRDYIARSIISPGEHVVVGYEKAKMPLLTNRIRDEELTQIVDLLLTNFVKKSNEN
ncbi:MAG: cytochrome c oxidase subunit II [Ignavibacteria bacterium]|nr:cytochrome c oxidase subunit II [Ignavibacteria bacterium]